MIAQDCRGAADQRFGGAMARAMGLPGLDGSDGCAPASNVAAGCRADGNRITA
jgi:hypothetical protein